MQTIEPTKRGKTIPEASTAETQDVATQVQNKYVSPHILKEWFAWVRGLSWVWSKKQTFSEGLNIGNNPTPTNGDLYSNGTDIYAYLGGAVRNILTSQNGKVGRVLFVSKDGNNSSGTVGSMNFSYSSLQGAINNATMPGDVVIVFTGNYAESVTFSRSNLTIILVNATIQSISCTESLNIRIEGLGKSVVTTLSLGGNSTEIFEIENINVVTYNPGYRGSVYVRNSKILSIPVLSGSSNAQNIYAINSTITTKAIGGYGAPSSTIHLYATNCEILNSDIVVGYLEGCYLKNCLLLPSAKTNLNGCSLDEVEFYFQGSIGYDLVFSGCVIKKRGSFLTGFFLSSIINVYFKNTISDSDFLTSLHTSLSSATINKHLPQPSDLTILPTANIAKFLYTKKVMP